MRTVQLAIAFVGLGLIAGPARSDDKAELGLAYAAAQQENVDQLKSYRWKTHTTMKSEGETKFEFTVANRLNEKGEMVQELEASESSVKKKRGARGRAQKNAMADLDALLKETIAVMASYLFMSKGQEVDFFDKAKITDGEDDLEGTRRVQASNVSVEGDTVTKWIEPDTLRPKRIDFDVMVDGHAVTGEVMYRAIEDGPNVPRFGTIRIADMAGLIEIEFLDYSAQL